MLLVSQSPHIRTTQSTHRIMLDVIIALLPALVVSVMFFGMSALFITLVAVFSCALFELLIVRFFLRDMNHSIFDGSAVVTGILLAYNLPAGIPIWMVIVGSFVAIAIAKMSFGGLGNNIFNPALVGRVFLLISFPVEMTKWPLPNVQSGLDGLTGPTPLGILKGGVLDGKSISQIPNIPEISDMIVGTIGGSIGEVSVIALALGGLYLLIRRIITWHIPLAVLGSMFVFGGVCYMVNPLYFIHPLYHIVAGGAMLGALFMATDMATSPMTKKAMFVYGIGIGAITMVIRLWGAYPEGMSFAILFMNALVPLLDKMHPSRFGVDKKRKLKWQKRYHLH